MKYLLFRSLLTCRRHSLHHDHSHSLQTRIHTVYHNEEDPSLTVPFSVHQRQIRFSPELIIKNPVYQSTSDVMHSPVEEVIIRPTRISSFLFQSRRSELRANCDTFELVAVGISFDPPECVENEGNASWDSPNPDIFLNAPFRFAPSPTTSLWFFLRNRSSKIHSLDLKKHRLLRYFKKFNP